MKLLFSIVLTFLFFSANAQKHTEEVIDAKGITRIVFSSDEVFRIHLKAIPGDEIKITSHTEGEYYNNISLDTEVQSNTLQVSSRYREMLQGGFDKLSAHKVFSMEVTLEVPINMIAEVTSNLASVYISGDFEHVLVQLNSGSCYFKDFNGDAVVNTFNGNILGDVAAGNFEAESRHGVVNVPENTQNGHKMVITSINGNIKLTETK
ncbi:hypothetical protein [Salinimicrobium oceani]|uniref:Adhesin domain-containing protein n=1 Tax=Salinimicrobium oceani TaxID=2722702 RepID=A0ABX1CX71_9FLAO|nr:hypothetical protein [Salinimicrobium oceani]NJW52878.1 hypothetical protein [Salinimicrobium oceani]